MFWTVFWGVVCAFLFISIGIPIIFGILGTGFSIADSAIQSSKDVRNKSPQSRNGPMMPDKLILDLPESPKYSADLNDGELDNFRRSKYKVLVIDNDKDFREVTKEIFKEHNIYVVEAINGIDGLKKLEERAYDVVLLDIVMPYLDGINLLKEVQKQPEKYNTPYFIVISNFPYEEISNKTQGADSGIILPKDIAIDRLLQIVIGASTERIGPAISEDKISEISSSKFSMLFVASEKGMADYYLQNLNGEVANVRAISGYDGLEKMKQMEFDVVVTDLIMAYMDGLEMLKKTNEHPEIYHNPKIIFLTGISPKSLAYDKAIESGAKDYLYRYEMDNEQFAKYIKNWLDTNV